MKKIREKLFVVFFIVACVALMVLQGKRKPYDLPKIVWTHWESEVVPDNFKHIIDQRRKVLPDWDIRFVTTEQVLTEAGAAAPSVLHTHKKQHQADWIRMYLLEKYGGVWMDMGILCNQSITPLWNECARHKAELSIFYLESNTVDKRYPVIENWFIMAPKGSEIVTRWKNQYENALNMGFVQYKKFLESQHIQLHKIYKDFSDTYLTQHGCIQYVLQRDMPPGALILYHRAEDTMFKLQHECKWNRDCLAQKLSNKAEVAKIPYIKLRGGERSLFKGF